MATPAADVVDCGAAVEESGRARCHERLPAAFPRLLRAAYGAESLAKVQLGGAVDIVSRLPCAHATVRPSDVILCVPFGQGHFSSRSHADREWGIERGVRRVERKPEEAADHIR